MTTVAEQYGLQVHQAPLYYHELNSTHTRYERIVASASDRDLMIQWSLLLVATLVATLTVISAFADFLQCQGPIFLLQSILDLFNDPRPLLQWHACSFLHS